MDIFTPGFLKVHSSQLLWQQQAEASQARLAAQANSGAPGLWSANLLIPRDGEEICGTKQISGGS